MNVTELDFIEEIYTFNKVQFNIAVPATNALQHWHIHNKKEFPFWAKIWPASKALCIFLEANTELYKQNKVVEIAGGLGLPSFVCAVFATTVFYTDYAADAVVWFQKQQPYLLSSNINCIQYNWYDELNIDADMYLFSDVNYNITDFKAVSSCIEKLLSRRKIVIISTPERIVAKQFIQPFIGNIKRHQQYNVDGVDCSVLMLQ